MPKYKRHKTKYPGVYYINGTSSLTGKNEKIYYIFYRINGNKVEEKVGRQYKDAMTPASASLIRASKIKGELEPNKTKRDKPQEDSWTLNKIWLLYKKEKSDLRGIKNDEYRYNKYIKYILGNKKPSEITPLDISQIKSSLSKSLKPQSIKHIIVQIQRIINFGSSMQLCTKLSFKVETPRFDNRKTEDLTPKQLQRLIEVLNEETYTDAANIMKLALYTGMRKSEILNLQWSDIDFDRGFIYIRNPKGIIKQHIPLNNSTQIVIESIVKKKNSDYIFPNRNGKKRDRTSFNKPINRIKKKAGLPKDFRPLHGLRHVYASMLASSGQVDMYTLQKLLTHKSPQMTQRYAHLRDETLKRASNLVGDIIEQALNNEKNKKTADSDDSR
ncbi:tyrosine-type recombinase/integrase [Candidatus Latescibacterota bacterium]